VNWKLTNRYSFYVQGRNISNVPVLRYASPSDAPDGFGGRNGKFDVK